LTGLTVVLIKGEEQNQINQFNLTYFCAYSNQEKVKKSQMSLLGLFGITFYGFLYNREESADINILFTFLAYLSKGHVSFCHHVAFSIFIISGFCDFLHQ
jgi:hypothetical protein